ncbi:MAG: 50S ribosomal protein L24 [Acidobacteria bacterium]|nr:50S ribosomal protein L24 [Acidobacteriota bacterium]
MTAQQNERTKTRLVRDDTVEVIAGRDSGKRGRVLDIDRKKGRILVEHAMVVKKHVRPNPQRQVKGGIAESEAFFDISNVMIVCPQCGPVRIGMLVGEDGSKTRICRKCEQPLEKKKRTAK